MKKNTLNNNDSLKSLIVLFKAYHSVMENVKESIADVDLSLNEFTALESIYHKEGLTTQALIDSVLIPNSSMTYVIAQLEKKGLILRKKDKADQRVINLYLTDKGRELFDEIYPKHYNDMRPIFDVLTQNEEVLLQTLLKKVGKEAKRRLDDETSL
ncbi:MarR family winged helix-turn-helix transcriptional regulator [Erysipelothrix urinaevulpis]|uniref:MarR family winged helix-turn-helix transcriptional regulator n=1 Tax=Erysipelothrix urinaevulpis TaxID=2683717 RepID=UPI0013581CDF|nr:MarR family transcriptional regulator [Erysipelothrix urinaevulpis]